MEQKKYFYFFLFFIDLDTLTWLTFSFTLIFLDCGSFSFACFVALEFLPAFSLICLPLPLGFTTTGVVIVLEGAKCESRLSSCEDLSLVVFCDTGLSLVTERFVEFDDLRGFLVASRLSCDDVDFRDRLLAFCAVFLLILLSTLDFLLS